MMLTARALLDEHPHPSDDEIREAIAGQICRCTGYKNIIAAVQWAANNPAPPRAAGGVSMATTEPRPITGYGRMKRKEDPRFVRGQGRYIDDLKLPGCSTARAALPARPRADRLHRHDGRGRPPEGQGRLHRRRPRGPRAGVDADDVGRHPGRARHGQGALPGPGGGLRRRGGPLLARDALELIDVEYEELPVVVDARKALDPAPRSSATTRRDQTDNHIFDWEAGDSALADEVFARADVVVTRDMIYPRCHPAPLETCGAVAQMDPGHGAAHAVDDDPGPARPPHRLRARGGHPEHKIRVIPGDIGGGFGNKVPVYPGYVCAIVGSILTGKPVKWMEDRSENLTSTGFARDYIMHGEIAATSDGRITGLRVDVLADHGAFNATRQPSKYPAGLLPHLLGSYDLEAAHCKVRGVYTNKAPGRGGLPLLVPRHGGRLPRRADGRRARDGARRPIRRSCA
jgi:carbon-monoxide dehydrogenase large subunit